MALPSGHRRSLRRAHQAPSRAAEQTELRGVVDVRREVADTSALARIVIAELPLVVEDLFPLLGQAHDGIRGSCQLMASRAGEPTRENRFKLLSIDYCHAPWSNSP